MAGQDARRVTLRVPYVVRGREGRRAVERAVSEEVAFDLPVRRPDAMPVVMRVERFTPPGEHEDAWTLAGALGATVPMRPPRQTLTFRHDGDGLLRPLTAPEDATPLGVEGLASLTDLVRRGEATDGGRDGSPWVEWMQYPTATADHPQPLSLPDRADASPPRLTHDGRAQAMALATRALEGACVCGDGIWVRSAAPLLTAYVLGDNTVTGASLEVPGRDAALSHGMGEEGRSARSRLAERALAVANVWDDVETARLSVKLSGDFGRPDLDSLNLRLLAAAVLDVTRSMTFRSGSPEARHAASGLDLALERHSGGGCATDRAFAEVLSWAHALRACAEGPGHVPHGHVDQVVALCRGWARLAVPERDAGMARALALEGDVGAEVTDLRL